MAFFAKLDGDAEKGWMGEVHDGSTLTTHNPDGETLLEALSNMLKAHFGVHPTNAVAEPMPESQVDALIAADASPPAATPEYDKMSAADLKDHMAAHDEPYVNKAQAADFLQGKADEAAATD